MQLTATAILFDLDGTLVDSTPSVTRHWQRWAAANGLDAEYVISIAHGRPTEMTIAELTPHVDARAEAMRLDNEQAVDFEGISAVPGALELVRSLPLDRWAVVTSGTLPVATNRLRHCGFPEPRVLVTPEFVQNGKPSPEPYLLGAKKLGVDPRRCIVFEDTPAGITSGVAAGARVVALATTYERARLVCDIILDDLRTVTAQLADDELLLTIG